MSIDFLFVLKFLSDKDAKKTQKISKNTILVLLMTETIWKKKHSVSSAKERIILTKTTLCQFMLFLSPMLR